MTIEVDFSKLRTSWTKYDAVQVMDVISSITTLHQFINKKVKIDQPILKSFLGMRSLGETIPEYWMQIQDYPNEKKLFALLSALFMHGGIIQEFARKYSKGNMKGLFIVEEGKQGTNIRSALVESGASPIIYRRSPKVPFDFGPIFQNPEVGKLFKKVLIERISRLTKKGFTESEFYEICFMNNFHKALSISQDQFKFWLEGNEVFKDSFINSVRIANFFSVKEIELNFSGAKEIYFLGENGDGKSLVLMAIYLTFNGNYITQKTDQAKTGIAADIIRKNQNIQLSGNDCENKEYNPQKGIYINNLFGYGTHRGRCSKDNPEEYGFMSLFDSNQTLLHPVSWLTRQKVLELEKNSDVKNLNAGITNLFSLGSLKEMFYELLEKKVEIIVEGNDVHFIEKGFKLSFEELSEGYRSIIIFVSDLIYRLNRNANEGDTVKDIKGIVLVDEIDLHLHPKWQRNIVQKLRKLFPNVQFIFTTHSPTIIQGASEDSIIYRVYRNSEDGITHIGEAYYRKDLDHLMINTLLTSPLFGLNDSRMNPGDNDADTSDTYLAYRINKKLEKELERQKAEGKQFINDSDIDQLIQKIIDEELGKHDKD